MSTQKIESPRAYVVDITDLDLHPVPETNRPVHHMGRMQIGLY